MKELNIAVNGEQKEIILREGKALDQFHPDRIKLTGRIDSISSFLSKRFVAEGTAREGKGLQKVDPDKTVVIVNEDEMWIELWLDPQDHFGTVIKAMLEFSSELKQFGIQLKADGQPRQWSRKELINLIRYNRRFFNPDKYEILLNAYQKLNYTVTANVKNESDNRGNRDQEFKKVIDSQHIPTTFALTLPIFKGEPERTFTVEICFEATDAAFVVWFESPELTDIIEKDRKDLFARELEKCEEFAIISK